MPGTQAQAIRRLLERALEDPAVRSVFRREARRVNRQIGRVNRQMGTETYEEEGAMVDRIAS